MSVFRAELPSDSPTNGRAADWPNINEDFVVRFVRSLRFLAASVLAASLLTSASGAIAGAWPNRAIKLVVPFPPVSSDGQFSKRSLQIIKRTHKSSGLDAGRPSAATCRNLPRPGLTRGASHATWDAIVDRSLSLSTDMASTSQSLGQRQQDAVLGVPSQRNGFARRKLRQAFRI